MLSLGLILLGSSLKLQEIPINRSLKENEAFTLKTFTSIKVGPQRIVVDGKYAHTCIDIDDKGIQHIEVSCLEGTEKVGDAEAESTKGETYNYFLNTRGQRFEYEEIRVTLKDDPINFMLAEIHAKLKDHSVVPGETWTDKSAHTYYTITVGQPKKFMQTDCILVVRKGMFINGIAGEYKEETWYRIADGQLMYQQSSADHIKAEGMQEVDFFERNEYLPEK